MKALIIGLGLTMAALSPASAQWGVQTWGYSTVPSWGAPAYGVAPQYDGDRCFYVPGRFERERCRRLRAWRRGW